MKRLMWRLPSLPTAEGLAALVAAGALSIQEARQIMLGETGEEKEEDK